MSDKLIEDTYPSAQESIGSIAFNRLVDKLECGQIMTKELETLEFSTELNTAWQIIKKQDMQALPVVCEQGRLLGIVTRSDFLKQVDTEEFLSFTQKLQNFLNRNHSSESNKPKVVGQIMRTNIHSVLDTSAMLEVVPMMLEHKVRHVAVVNSQGKFVGMINQTNLIAALYQTISPFVNNFN